MVVADGPGTTVATRPGRSNRRLDRALPLAFGRRAASPVGCGTPTGRLGRWQCPIPSCAVGCTGRRERGRARAELERGGRERLVNPGRNLECNGNIFQTEPIKSETVVDDQGCAEK
jgi:hypothetical protein